MCKCDLLALSLSTSRINNNILYLWNALKASLKVGQYFMIVVVECLLVCALLVFCKIFHLHRKMDESPMGKHKF